FFFQAEDGIRDGHVTGSDVCSSDLGPGDDRVGEPVGGVVAAGALDLRPAVVAAGFDYVDLVEPVLAELRREEGAVFVPGESLDVAVSVAVDEVAERIALGGLAAGRHAQDLAPEAVGVLGARADAGVA